MIDLPCSRLKTLFTIFFGCVILSRNGGFLNISCEKLRFKIENGSFRKYTFFGVGKLIIAQLSAPLLDHYSNCEKSNSLILPIEKYVLLNILKGTGL